jgi:hypothetical protein
LYFSKQHVHIPDSKYREDINNAAAKYPTLPPVISVTKSDLNFATTMLSGTTEQKWPPQPATIFSFSQSGSLLMTSAALHGLPCLVFAAKGAFFIQDMHRYAVAAWVYHTGLPRLKSGYRHFGQTFLSTSLAKTLGNDEEKSLIHQCLPLDTLASRDASCNVI